MKKIKLEHVERLSRGKRSGANIGSRAVGHHLRAHERTQYNRALKMGYLEITAQDRENLWNLWEKVCLVKEIEFLVLIKYPSSGLGMVYVNGEKLMSDDLKLSKKFVREMALNLQQTA